MAAQGQSGFPQYKKPGSGPAATDFVAPFLDGGAGRSGPLEELAQDGVRRGRFLVWSGGARGTLCAPQKPERHNGACRDVTVASFGLGEGRGGPVPLLRNLSGTTEPAAT